MHPSGLREEDTALRGHGCVVLQQMLQTRDAALAGVRSLNRLRQLHLIAHQHDVASGHAHGDDVGEANLRSEEHTSELQSLMRISYAVFCLKKTNKNTPTTTTK